MTNWTEYNDRNSREVFDAFAEALQPVLNKIDARWSVHHLELVRPPPNFVRNEMRVEIRIVLEADIHGKQNESTRKLEGT
jgi:hypothetical protein